MEILLVLGLFVASAVVINLGIKALSSLLALSFYASIAFLAVMALVYLIAFPIGEVLPLAFQAFLVKAVHERFTLVAYLIGIAYVFRILSQYRWENVNPSVVYRFLTVAFYSLLTASLVGSTLSLIFESLIFESVELEVESLLGYEIVDLVGGIICSYLLVVNFWAFVFFSFDKVISVVSGSISNFFEWLFRVEFFGVMIFEWLLGIKILEVSIVECLLEFIDRLFLRVPERVLHSYTAYGGVIGSFLVRNFMNHKMTSKKFLSVHDVIVKKQLFFWSSLATVDLLIWIFKS